MFDPKVAQLAVASRDALPLDAILLGTKTVDTGYLTLDDVKFDDVPGSDHIKTVFANNMLLDRIEEFIYLLVEFDVYLDASVVQWYITFPNDGIKVYFALSETKNEILGGLY